MPMHPHVLLVNPNRVRPPIAPLALEYLAHALRRAGYEPRLLDLAWLPEAGPALESAARSALAERPVLVGVTIRNLDDSSRGSGVSFLEEHREVVALVRRHTDAPVVLGGVGLSIEPAAALEVLGADYAIRGEGESAL